MMVVLQ